MAQLHLCGQMKAEFEIKAPADMIHEIFSRKQYYSSACSPNIVKSVELQEGQWGAEGSVLIWNYSHNGKAVTTKAVLETADYKDKIVSYKVIEGSPLELYKSFKYIFQASPKGDGSMVSCTLEYEKLNENVEEPNSMLKLATENTKITAAYLTKA